MSARGSVQASLAEIPQKASKELKKSDTKDSTLATVAVHTVENEPPKVLTNVKKIFARNSVAIFPAFDQRTKRCSARKGKVSAHPTNAENRKEENMATRNVVDLLNISPRAARLLLTQSFWWKRKEQSIQEKLQQDPSK